MSEHLERFYDLLARLAALPGQGQPLTTYQGRSAWPDRGVYFFLEPGETRAGTGSPRVVRVGTHALTTGANSRLWGRLRAHRGSKDGRGNHRGSVFRLHVGAALLRRDGGEVEFPNWGKGSSAPRPIRDAEVPHERRVSAHIGRMPVLWVAVPDEPGPDSERGYIERNAIALLSNGLAPLDPPSDDWLGRRSSRQEIRASGLWNLNHVLDAWDARFLDRLEELVTETGGLA